jgi:hypothetical protein
MESRTCEAEARARRAKGPTKGASPYQQRIQKAGTFVPAFCFNP